MRSTSFATICFLSAIHCFCFLSKAVAQEWVEKAPMPLPRYAMAAAAVGTDIYVFGGGNTESLVTNTTQCYATTTNTWKSCRAMPTKRLEMAALNVGGKIYVIGGYNSDDAALSTVEIYDPAGDSWSFGTPMPTPRSRIFGAVIDDKIYITGGWPGSYNTLEIYDPAADTWTSGAPMPEGILQNNSGVAFDGRFFAIGGDSYGGDYFYNTNYAYNASANEWESKAAMPEHLFAGAVAAFEGKLHYFGGSQNDPAIENNFDTHYIYDPTGDSWDTGIALPGKLANLVSITVGDGIYVMGGYEECYECVRIAGINIKYTVPAPSSVTGPAVENFSLYPNPVKNILYISVPGNVASKNIYITDLSGRTVLSLGTNEECVTVNTGNLPGGVYLLNLSTGKDKKTQCFVKE